MRQADLCSGAVLFMVSLLAVLVVIPAQIEAAPDGFVSPRLVPNLMMGLIGLLSVILMIRGWRGHGYGATEHAKVFRRSEIVALGKIAAIFALSLGLFVADWVAGAAVVLIAGTLIALGERRPLVILGLTGGMILAVWVLFYKILGTVIV